MEHFVYNKIKTVPFSQLTYLPWILGSSNTAPNATAGSPVHTTVDFLFFKLAYITQKYLAGEALKKIKNDNKKYS